MINFNDANRFLTQTDHDFSQQTIDMMISQAQTDLVKRGVSGIFIIPLVYLLGSLFTSNFFRDMPGLFWVLNFGYILISCSRLFGVVKLRGKNPSEQVRYQRYYFLSSLGSGLLFGIYSASALYYYQDSWHNVIMLFMVAGIAGGSVSSYSIWKRLNQTYLVVLLGPLILISLVFFNSNMLAVPVLCLVSFIYSYAQVKHWNNGYWLALINTHLLEEEIQKHQKVQAALLLEMQERKLAKEVAEKANMVKTEFLTNISHELRTPMHAVLSYARFGLQRTGKVPEGKLVTYFQQIEISAKRLMVLLNDLLDLAKLEAGRMDFDIKNKNISLEIKHVIAEFSSICHDQKIVIRQADQEPMYGLFDADKITQVLRNLLSNAIKFSHSGGEILIETRYEKTDAGNVIVVRVQDQGLGIFDKFIQSSKTKTGAGGTGLGLSICKEMIEKQNGRIWAENNSDQGVSFFFTLPEGSSGNQTD